MVVQCGDKRKKTCNQCESLKEINYMNDNLCAKCRSIVNKAKRAAKRAAEGKPPKGSGRSKFCSKCGAEKDHAYKDSGYCRSCKAEAVSKKLADAREEKGLQAWGSGRKLTCCRCDKVKENPTLGYCYECHRTLDREWRLQTGRSQKIRTGKCQCGQEFASYSNCYCVDCASIWRKEYLASHPEVRQRMYDRRNEIRKNDPVEMVKVYVRSMTGRAIKTGKLMKMPCEVCFAEENVEAHHDDYLKPLDVRWLCKTHHAEHHKNDKHKDI